MDISKRIAQSLASRGKQDKAQIAGRGLLTAPDHAVALPQPADGPFHDVALPVQRPAVVDRLPSVLANDAVPVPEAARQVSPRDPCAQEVVDSVQEATKIRVRTHAHRRILLLQTEKNLEFVGAQCVTGHGGRAVKKSAT